MLFDNIFTYRLKCLKLAHHLSNSQLAILLGLKSRGTTGDLLSGKAVPSFKNLNNIADLFAVSLDWLVGRSNVPYTDELLLRIEAEFWNVLTLNMDQIGEIGLQFPSPPKKYVNVKTRSKSYSLVVRANIIFLYMVIFLTAIMLNSAEDGMDESTSVLTNKSDESSENPSDMLLKDMEDNNAYMKVLSKKYKLPIAELIKKLFSGEIDKPIFDVIKFVNMGYQESPI